MSEVAGINDIDFDDDDDFYVGENQESSEDNDDDSGHSGYIDYGEDNEQYVVDEDADPDDEDNFSDDEDSDDEEELTVIDVLLKSKGITDPRNVKFEDGNGVIHDVDFYDLSPEEQFNILNTNDEDPDYALSEEETELLNIIRENKLKPSEYLAYVQEQAVKELRESSNNDSDFEVNSLSNEELFILDMKDKFPDLTDEELISSLDQDMRNPDLFEKKVNGLRSVYVQKELEYKAGKAAEVEANKQKIQNEFSGRIIETINNIDSIGEFELELSDKEEIAEFLTGQDATGKRHIAKALEEPETLMKMTWFALHGDKAMSDLSSYYKDRIVEYSNVNYEKGYNDALLAFQQQQRQAPRVVTQQGGSRKGVDNKRILSIHDLD